MKKPLILILTLTCLSAAAHAGSPSNKLPGFFADDILHIPE